MTQMFTKAQPNRDPIPVTPPPPMPDPFSPASVEAARQTAIAAAGRSGRSGSILTTAASRSTIAGSGAFGGTSGAYSNQVLGGK